MTADKLSVAWSMIHGALTSPFLARCSVSQSAQGFLAVPLCSLLKEGQIEELFRLHIWLPDGRRGNGDVAIHSHQSFAQSWILAGEGRDLAFDIDPECDPSDASHALYKLSWTGEEKKDTGKSYKTHQSSSTVVNSGKMVHVAQSGSAIHTRNMSYTIPSASFHTTEVSPDAFHATLFFFDASRGFDKDAGIVGPKDGTSYTSPRAPEVEVTSKTLANRVDIIRAWESNMEHGLDHTHKAEAEHALREYNTALGICETMESLGLSNVSRYRRDALTRIGCANRRFGRYEQAKVFLESALETDTEPSLAQASILGELVVVLRHMNLLDDAKRACELQYNTSKRVDSEEEMCRALGNLGMVNFQVFLLNGDRSLLKQAINQIEERVRIARRMRLKFEKEAKGLETGAIKSARIREVVGLGRLSLCYTANGDLQKAVEAGIEALELSLTGDDPVSTAIARFLYGRALLRSGQRDQAIEQFNPPGTACTPAMAFCKEPSGEHRGYLREITEAGTDVSCTDDDGYTALDYAVFSGDVEARHIVLDGLRRNASGLSDAGLESHLQDLQHESQLRKAYRELYQEKLRFAFHDRGADRMNALRQTYAQARDEDEAKSMLFEGFKSIPYSDFVKLNRLPHSRDKLAQELTLGGGQSRDQVTDFVIFFSYRWLGPVTGPPQPDDENNTQYKRMVTATEEFLVLHPHVDRDHLGIWLVSALLWLVR